jgi:hypothetical protein
VALGYTPKATVNYAATMAARHDPTLPTTTPRLLGHRLRLHEHLRRPIALQLRRLYLAGATIRDLQALTGRHHSTVLDLLHSVQAPMRRPGKTTPYRNGPLT